jgi:hypothetical protein
MQAIDLYQIILDGLVTVLEKHGINNVRIENGLTLSIAEKCIEKMNDIKNKECPNCGEKAGTYSLGECCNACHHEI